VFNASGVYEGGYTFSPYGETRTINSTNLGVTTNNQRYIGGHMESSATYKLGARYSDTTTGRFTQYDPAGQEANPYSYAGCNPINAKDPSGLLALSCTTTLIKASVSLISFMLSVATLIAGAATIVGGIVGAIRVAVGGAVLTYRIADAIKKC
jgi:RHS repeat-associated protein